MLILVSIAAAMLIGVFVMAFLYSNRSMLAALELINGLILPLSYFFAVFSMAGILLKMSGSDIMLIFSTTGIVCGHFLKRYTKPKSERG